MTNRQRNKRWRVKALHDMRADPNHYLHGTLKGYGLGCDCPKCRSREVYGLIDAQRKLRKDRAIVNDRSLAAHGTETRYQYGCPCRVCRDAHAAHIRRYRKGKDV